MSETKRKRGAPALYDWRELYKEFEKVETHRFLNEWCDERGLSYTNTSREFTKIRNERIAQIRAHASKRLIMAAPKAVDGIIADLDSDDEGTRYKNRRMVLEAAEIVGNNGKDNKTQINVIIPPLFGAAYAEDAERMLNGAITISGDSGTGEGTEIKRLDAKSDNGTPD